MSDTPCDNHAKDHYDGCLWCALDNEQARGIHSCGPNCQQPMCVMRRRLETADASLVAARRYVETLETRIGFANVPIGMCKHCFICGTKPGSHHLSDCPAYSVATKEVESDE